MASTRTYKLDEVLALRAPAPAWRYVAVLPSLSNTNTNTGGTRGVGGFADLNVPQSKFSGNVVPHILVESFEVTHMGINSVQRYYSARTINFPGRLSVSSFSINFYETDDYQVTDYLTLWKNNVVNDYANFGLPKDYKKPVRLFAFDFQGNNTATFYLDGVYPEQIQSYQYESSSSDRLKVGCTFSVDFSVFQKGSAGGGSYRLALNTLNSGNSAFA